MSKVLYHVDLLVDRLALVRARDPEPPNPDAIAAWSDQDFAREVARCERSHEGFDHLMDSWMKPALRCILNTEKLDEMLEKCGEKVILRVSLERLEVEPA
jgi:hypothetical protein